VWATGGMIVLFPFLSDTSDWNHWFDSCLPLHLCYRQSATCLCI
jgi:hypothetical protein